MSGNLCFSGSRCLREQTAPCVLVKPSTTNCASSRWEPLPVLPGPYWGCGTQGVLLGAAKSPALGVGLVPQRMETRDVILSWGGGWCAFEDVGDGLCSLGLGDGTEGCKSIFVVGRDEVFPVCFSCCCFSHCWKESLQGCEMQLFERPLAMRAWPFCLP